MRTLTLFLLALVLSLNISAKGFLGKHGVFSFNATEFFHQQKLNLEYTQLLSRQFTFGVYVSHLDYSAKLNRDNSLSYLIENLTPAGDKIGFKGQELFLRFSKGNKFENNIMPIGYSVELGLGIANYTINEQFQQDYGGLIVRENSRFSLMYEASLKRTVNLYKSLNFFAKASGGLISTLYASKEEDTIRDEVYYGLPKRGMNMSYFQGSSSYIQRLYLNIHLGLSILI